MEFSHHLHNKLARLKLVMNIASIKHFLNPYGKLIGCHKFTSYVLLIGLTMVLIKQFSCQLILFELRLNLYDIKHIIAERTLRDLPNTGACYSCVFLNTRKSIV